jgi:hypothetical protein
MYTQPHTLSLYQKPALGNDFLRRLPVYNYRHTIAAVGGFDTASCDIAIRSREEGQQFLDQYIGNRVAFYVDNPVEPIWEGFINRMTFDAGGVQYTISLDEMTNRVTVTYTDVAASATNAQITPTHKRCTASNRKISTSDTCEQVRAQSVYAIPCWRKKHTRYRVSHAVKVAGYCISKCSAFTTHCNGASTHSLRRSRNH